MREGTNLGYAYCASVAEQEGLRLLAIKGPVRTAHGLSSARLSQDVDVWVPPDALGAMKTALRRRGWREAEEGRSLDLLGPHAAVFSHDAWPMTLDVHVSFPGFLAPRERVFEALWSRRSRVAIAGQPVWATDLVSTVLVDALNELRAGARGKQAVTALAEHARSRLGPDGMTELHVLCQVAGAAYSAAEFLVQLDPGYSHSVSRQSTGESEREWELRVTSADVPTVDWLHALVTLPWRERPALIRRAVFLTPAEIRHLYPAARTGRWGRARARLRRLWTGLTDLPRGIRTLRSYRRSQRP